MNDFDEYLVAREPDKRERAYGCATAIGLQEVDGLKVSDFLLNTAKRNIEGEITQAEAVKNLHRHDAVESSGDVGINVGIKLNDVLSRTEENAVKAILRDNRITAKALSVVLGVTLRQAERIMVSLKKKANLRREGSRKNGHWVFGD